MDTEYEKFCEEITKKAVADTVTKLLKYPFGFHGDTGIRDFLYARLHCHGGDRLDFNDGRPGYSTLLLQSEHYTRVKFMVKGKTGKGARFDVALTAPPSTDEPIEARYAHNLDAVFAFELGKNKAKSYVIDTEMLNHGPDDIRGTSDTSKLYRELKHKNLKQGWAIEFYDSTRVGAARLARIVTPTLDICRRVDLHESRKLVVIFVAFAPDGNHHLSSNDASVEAELIQKLAGAGLVAGSEIADYAHKAVAR